MKLLVISQYFYPEQFRVSDVCFHLTAIGHDITVLTGLPNYPMGELFDGFEWDELKQSSQFDTVLDAYMEQINNVKVIRSKLFPRKTGKKNLVINYLSFAYHASKIARKISKQNKLHKRKKPNLNVFDFDRILVFQYSPVTMAFPAIVLKKGFKKHMGKEIPLSLYCFDLWPESIVSAGLPNHGPIYLTLLKLSQYLYEKADNIFISSKNFKKYFQEKLNISDNISYLPIYAEEIFSTDSKNFEDPETKLNKDFPSDCIHLVFAGNIGEMQSIDTIILAAAEVKKMNSNDCNSPKILFHIVGDGSALDRTIKLASSLNLINSEDATVIFHGRHPLEDMPKFYAIADAMLVTLKSDPFISYTLPGKVQSYMASGKPILAAIDGETASVISESHCGLCCPAEDYLAFAEIINKFAREKENHRSYGDHSKSYYQNYFSKDSFFDKLLKLLSL